MVNGKSKNEFVSVAADTGRSKQIRISIVNHFVFAPSVVFAPLREIRLAASKFHAKRKAKLEAPGRTPI
jgi:hypothetical protein